MVFGTRLTAVLGVAAVLSGCKLHFSCAGVDQLPELKASQTDDKRTKRVVLKWRTFFYDEMGCRKG